MKKRPPREIKFRAWDSERKKMLSPQDLSQSRKYWRWLGLKDLPLMQFTGLKDKNGKEIYEGDILAIKFHPRYYERISWKGEPDCIAKVIWDFCGFRLAAKGKEDSRFADFHDEKGSYKMFEMSLRHTEVIGNIIENPELLP